MIHPRLLQRENRVLRGAEINIWQVPQSSHLAFSLCRVQFHARLPCYVNLGSKLPRSEARLVATYFEQTVEK